MNENESKGIGYWFASALMVVLAVGILLFLGKHSLNYFMTTFSAEDELYAYLGLTFTSVGVLGWTAILVWYARSNLQRAIALIMMIACAIGELAVAGFDMISERTGAAFTSQDIETQIWIVAGFGFLQGICMMVFHVGDFVWNLQWRSVKTSNQTAVSNNPLTIPRPLNPSLNEKQDFTE